MQGMMVMVLRHMNSSSRCQRKISYQNAITYMSNFNPCCKCRGIINWEIRNSMGFVGGNANALVHMYSKCGSIDDAQPVFGTTSHDTDF